MRPVPITLLIACLLAASTPATAQLDTDPGGIGIYFDPGATVVTAGGAGGDVIDAYLIGTRLASSGDIASWQATIAWSQGADVYGSPNGSYNYWTNMPGGTQWTFLALYEAAGLPAGSITLLATLQVHVLDGTVPIDLYVGDGGYYRLLPDSDEIPLHPSSGGTDLPVAVINGAAPVPATAATLGAVKALYR